MVSGILTFNLAPTCAPEQRDIHESFKHATMRMIDSDGQLDDDVSTHDNW